MRVLGHACVDFNMLQAKCFVFLCESCKIRSVFNQGGRLMFCESQFSIHIATFLKSTRYERIAITHMRESKKTMVVFFSENSCELSMGQGLCASKPMHAHVCTRTAIRLFGW